MLKTLVVFCLFVSKKKKVTDFQVVSSKPQLQMTARNNEQYQISSSSK